jgi:hypothetical protein
MQPSGQAARGLRLARGGGLSLALAAGLVLPPAALAALVPPPGERAGSVRAPHCTLTGAKTIAANRRVRVFEARDAVFGCRRTADRAYEIGHDGSECQNNDAIDTAVVAGNFAALNVRTCSLYDSESSVALVNLRDGRVRFRAAALSTPGSETSYEAIRGMVVTPAGRLAWVAVRIMRGAIADAEVRRRVPNSAERTVELDGGTTIDPRSLRKGDGRVLWRNAGLLRSARL